MHSNWVVLNMRSNSGDQTHALLLVTHTAAQGPLESSREGLYHCPDSAGWLWDVRLVV